MVTVSPPGSWSYALHLPYDPRAPRVARMMSRAVLGGHGLRELLDVTELLTSEVVTNAYRHSGGPALLRLRGVGDGKVRVSVWDTDSYIPAPFDRPPAGTAEPCRTPTSCHVPDDADGGRGLLLVRQWADTWGGCLLGGHLPGGSGGKLLWFEVGARAGAAPGALPAACGSEAADDPAGAAERWDPPEAAGSGSSAWRYDVPGPYAAGPTAPPRTGL